VQEPATSGVNLRDADPGLTPGATFFFARYARWCPGFRQGLLLARAEGKPKSSASFRKLTFFHSELLKPEA